MWSPLPAEEEASTEKCVTTLAAKKLAAVAPSTINVDDGNNTVVSTPGGHGKPINNGSPAPPPDVGLMLINHCRMVQDLTP